ncbi:tyrosine-type recombinase/integrase [Hoeflea sp. EC-HK425]|uniref:tyrosine-type recombinase/integrase n=1 Tax=Hoeflea sp. EC-HK425 TaxID=2038388 RepID=UPI00125886F9|nr:tyrosine-type recombinase/integrase [Hoeflea sp. EC-HK425]VVT15968.1 Integrase [Hoeflea sp. EC-HK425]
MDRAHLTDELIRGLAYAPASSERYEVYDASIENLAIKVGSKRKSFILVARFGGPASNTAKRSIGTFPKITTEAARIAAHDWNLKVKNGIDPAIELAKHREEEELRLRSTFASVMQDYIAYLPNRRKNLRAKDDIKFIKRNLLNPEKNPWLNKPISLVTDVDVETLVEELRGRAPSQAYHCLSKLKTFFRWAMNSKIRDKIGLTHNPVSHLEAASLNLGIDPRDRVFEYEEARAFLMSSTATPYPYGPCLRTLFETGQRIGAVSGMRWSQINFERKLWTIPGTRSKAAAPGRTSKGKVSHKVPLSDRMVERLLTIKMAQPSDHGDFVFSFTNGQTPIGNFSNLRRNKSEATTNDEANNARGRFDRLMSELLAEFGIDYEPWVWHDVRRTVRTHLEPITGRQEVAEAAIGHGKQGITRVYNLHTYRAEIRRAFNTWSELLERVEQGDCTIAEWEHDPDSF